MPNSLWCQNDPTVRITYNPPYPSSDPVQHGVIRIITKVRFSATPTEQAAPADQVIYLELSTPLATKTRVLKETTTPLTPQEFVSEDSEDLRVQHAPLEYFAPCRLFIELDDYFDPSQVPSQTPAHVEEVRVIVKNRHKETIAQHIFIAGTPPRHTLDFTVELEPRDHSPEVIADTSTWS